MIGLLTGTVFAKNQDPMILTVGGVGYAVHIPSRLAGTLKTGDTQTLFIHTHVRDDTLALYGFATHEELELFELLLEVSGIGPRTSLSIIEQGVPATVKAIAESDVDFFTSIPRLGKKNAQKIIIELKSKLGSIRELDLTGAFTSETKEVLDALLTMGFGKKEAIAAMKNLNPEDKTVEQKIRRALQILGKS